MSSRTLVLDETPDQKGRFHRESTEARRDDDGAVVVSGVLQGEAVEEWFGDWDHEFGLRIRPADLAPALIAVLAEAFATDRRMTYARLVEVLRSEGLEVSAWSWT